MTVQERMSMQLTIVRAAVEGLIAAGYRVGYHDGDTHCHEGEIVAQHENGTFFLTHSNWVGKGGASKPGSDDERPAYQSLLDAGYTHWFPLSAVNDAEGRGDA